MIFTRKTHNVLTKHGEITVVEGDIGLYIWTCSLIRQGFEGFLTFYTWVTILSKI